MWEGDQGRGEPMNVMPYVVQMWEHLEKMAVVAQSHLTDAKTRQKTWYDQSTQERSFDPGQQVLVMLPSHKSKQLVKLQGPYVVRRKLGPTYEVAMPGQDHAIWVLHINFLKQWVPCPDKSVQVLMIRQMEEEEELDDQFLPQPSLGNVSLDHLPQHHQSFQNILGLQT